jgi:hypothetical protein
MTYSTVILTLTIASLLWCFLQLAIQLLPERLAIHLRQDFFQFVGDLVGDIIEELILNQFD